jgi:branched-chain amino acid transport system permease protein
MASITNFPPAKAYAGAKRWLFLGIALAIVVSMFSGQFNRYYLGIAIDCGINIILAVSLNLINGHTGQFSLGHAGFMAVGGYTAAKFTLVCLPMVPEPLRPVLFLVALLLGGLTSAVTGLGVGIPSLRLRGDYLAIVTLGFGEIIRVIV